MVENRQHPLMDGATGATPLVLPKRPQVGPRSDKAGPDCALAAGGWQEAPATNSNSQAWQPWGKGLAVSRSALSSLGPVGTRLASLWHGGGPKWCIFRVASSLGPLKQDLREWVDRTGRWGPGVTLITGLPSPHPSTECPEWSLMAPEAFFLSQDPPKFRRHSRCSPLTNTG